MPTNSEILALVVVILAIFAAPLALRQAFGMAVQVIKSLISIWKH